jgi:hypothetical protein
MLNTGKGFINVSASAGSAFTTPVAARGAAFVDLNNDGQLDVVIATVSGAPLILRNNGTKNHWLGLMLIGAKQNRAGLGARVTVTDSIGRKQLFDVSNAGSYLSSNDSRTLVGLGAATGVASIEIRWPGGRTQTLTSPAIDKYLTISEPGAEQH